jgi:PHD/YefM family antitoxin component YafN of YafNO toxin-antitoxin module
MGVITFTDLRQHLSSHRDRVAETRDPLVVTRQGGKGNIVILS